MSEEVAAAPAAEGAPAAPGAEEEPPKKKRRSRFGDVPPAAAPATAPASEPVAPSTTGVSPLVAAQQALQGTGLAGPAVDPAGPTPGGGANAIPLGGGPAFEPPKPTLKPRPERLVGAKELRGLDAAAAVAAAAPKADFDDLAGMMGPTEPGVISETMKIPNEAVGLVIGRSGETIRQLQIRAGADIQVSRDDQYGEERGIVITGPPENVAMAKSLVQQIVSEKLEAIAGGGGASPTGASPTGAWPVSGGGGGGGGGSNETQFLIPQRHVGLVIGSGGQQIRQLQDSSGARIQVAKDPIPGSGHPLDHRQVTLSGDPSCVATAKQMIEHLMAQDRGAGAAMGMGGGGGGMPGAVKKVIEIPNACVGGVIGAQGRQIKYMQETSGAHIQMQKNEEVAPGATMREVTVEGQQAQVDIAVQLIQREVEQQQNRGTGGSSVPGMRPGMQQPMMRGGMVMQGQRYPQQQWGGQPGYGQQMGGMQPMGYGQQMGGYNPQMQQQQQQAMLYQQQMQGPYAAQWQAYYAQQAAQQQQQTGAAEAGGAATDGADDDVPPPPPPGA